MGRCELFISIVPPTSAAFQSHIDKLPTALAVPLPTLAPFSCQLCNQPRRTLKAGMYIRRLEVPTCLTVISTELLCQKLPGKSAAPWVEGRVDSG